MTGFHKFSFFKLNVHILNGFPSVRTFTQVDDWPFSILFKDGVVNRECLHCIVCGTYQINL